MVGHLLYNAGRVPLFMGKQEMFRWPVVGPVMRFTGQIPVNRNSPDAAFSLQHAVAALEAGECIVIYPEGTVTREPDYWPMAARTGSRPAGPAVGRAGDPGRAVGRSSDPRPGPEARGCCHVVRSPSWSGRPWTSGPTVRKGAPWTALQAATRRVMAAITGQLAQLRGEPAPLRVDPPTAGTA